MNIREELKKKVFELTCSDGWELRSDLPPKCSIGRVMAALHKKHSYFNSLPNLLFAKAEAADFNLLDEWKLMDDDGKECTDDAQEDKLIEQIYNLLK